jgi:uncharacterized protein involved in cysteine biosynthesis
MKFFKNFDFSLFTIYLVIIVVVKLSYSITFFNIAYHQLFTDADDKYIDKLDTENDWLEWLFLVLVFVLMTILFTTSDKEVIISGHTKQILSVASTIGIYSQFQQKKFFGLGKYIPFLN